jgi:hypothetical protein
LREDFNLDLPVRGGWGYALDDAIIIDKSLAADEMLFNGVGYEYTIVEKRIYEELIVCRPHHDRFGAIRWDLKKQSTLDAHGRQYDRLEFYVTCFRDPAIDMLRMDIANAKTPEAFERHEQLRQQHLCYYNTEYYFEITSFYGV